MRIMVIDGNSIVNRAFYGIKFLSAPDGTPTNAVYGFISIIKKLYDDIKPDGICVAFDMREPTFRHKADPEYKATRKGMPEDLALQMPVLKSLLEAMKINYFQISGYEADDIIGTISERLSASGDSCIVVTGDKDSLQLIGKNTEVCLVRSGAGKSSSEIYTEDVFIAEYGFSPDKMVDLKAIMGDSSDNIKGVPGVGEKTASKLLRETGSLKAVYENIEKLGLSDSVKKKMLDGKESAFHSYWLATIFKYVPIEFNKDDLLWSFIPNEETFSILSRLGFNRYISEWGFFEQSKITEETEQRETDNIVKCNGVSELKEISYNNPIVLRFDDASGEFLIYDGRFTYSLTNYDAAGITGYVCSLSGNNNRIIVHGLKRFLRYLSLSFADFTKCEFFDTELAAYVLNPGKGDYSIESLKTEYGIKEGNIEAALYHLYEILNSELSDDLRKLLNDIEIPLAFVLNSMEQSGFRVDRNALSDFGLLLNEKIEYCQNMVFKDAGHEFNINSPKQLGTVLFEELQLPYGKKTKTGWSTGADVLEKLKFVHPIINNVLDFRTYTKLKSTYSDGLIKEIKPDGKIHTSFQMTATATGRLSSTEPNLQNIPIRKSIGAEIRKMFTASEGCVLIDADYSQIELRVLAHISGDAAMKQAFLSGEDFHRQTAAFVYGVPYEAVTQQMRSSAKAVNFGIIYGMSAFTLSQDIGISVSEAKKYISNYLNKFSGVAEYMDKVVINAKNDGYVSSLYGRIRKMPELESSNFQVRAFGERVALNTPIQSTAADIIKIAMVNVNRRLIQEKLRAHLILQVHDELIVEAPENEAERVKSLLKEEMESAVNLEVPLMVDVGIGYNWAEAH